MLGSLDLQAVTCKVILSSQLPNVSQSLLSHSDSSDGCVGGFQMYDRPVFWAQVTSLVPYDSLML